MILFESEGLSPLVWEPDRAYVAPNCYLLTSFSSLLPYLLAYPANLGTFLAGRRIRLRPPCPTISFFSPSNKYTSPPATLDVFIGLLHLML